MDYTRYACLAVLLVLLVWYFASWGGKPRDGFYTKYSQEEPTRSYVPYSGTLPYGQWGARPWGAAEPYDQASRCL